MNFQKENMFTENFHHYNIEIDSIQKNIIEIHNDINELEQIKKRKLESLYKEQNNVS